VEEDEIGRACSLNAAKRNTYRILVGKQKEKDDYEDEDVGGRIILKYISERQDVVVWTGLIWLRRALVNTVMNL
jgi:hypothetical protein